MSTRLELLKAYLNEDPSDSFLRYAIALEYLAANDATSAFEQLKTLLVDDTDYLAAYYMAGKASETLGDIPAAIGFYKSGIKLAEQKQDFHTLGELRNALEDIEERE